MTLRFFATVAALPLSIGLFFGCSSDDSPGGGNTTPEAGAGTGGMASITDYDCKKNKWADVSDECWSCLCNDCEPTLDACNQDCMSIFKCAGEKQTLVNKGDDIACEIRATTIECLKTPEAQAQAQALITFDTCLITAPKPSGGFRACEKECGVPYPGDVCTRYPAAM